MFKNYAHYYNLLYKDKDYTAECAHVDALIRQYSKPGVSKLLDIGCGTGRHAHGMTELGYRVAGIDQSEEMINSAKARAIPGAEFQVGDATSFKLGRHFDIVTSLFHVISYQTTNLAVQQTFARAAEHLDPGGLFIFDFWYGPAVVTERPAVRIKRLEDEKIKVTRLTEPVWKCNENVVDVHFELLITDKATDQVETVKELHPMRYFFKPEMELFLAVAGFSLKYCKEWMTGNEPSDHTWGVCCVAEKKH